MLKQLVRSNPEHYIVVGVPQSIWFIGLSDLVFGLKSYRLWMFLGWQDIRQRYSRSILGPLWLTLSMGIMVTIMSVLYGRLFKLPLEVYTPFLASGIIIWGFISTLLNEGCASLIAADSLIKQVRMPISLHVWRVVFRNLLIFLHNVVILVPIWLIFDTPVSLPRLMVAILAVMVVAINGFWCSLILGGLCARFRDISPIVTSLVQAIFFVTPIMWLPSILEGKGVGWWLIVINPFYHFLEIIRAPLLGMSSPLDSWLVVIAITFVGLLSGIIFLGRFKNRFAYWL
jgi:ABC-type polysaccharide/polyol phosphate export permease